MIRGSLGATVTVHTGEEEEEEGTVQAAGNIYKMCLYEAQNGKTKYRLNN